MIPNAEPEKNEQCISTTWESQNDAKRSNIIVPSALTKKKSVQWAPFATQTFIEHIKEMSDSEINERWYDKFDFKAFKSDCSNTVKIAKEKRKMVEEKCSVASSEGCYTTILGLYHLIDSNRIGLRRSRREYVWDQVMAEQEIQMQRGKKVSMTRIAKSCKKVSGQCQLEALQRGLQVGKEVRMEHMDQGNDQILAANFH